MTGEWIAPFPRVLPDLESVDSREEEGGRKDRWNAGWTDGRTELLQEAEPPRASAGISESDKAQLRDASTAHQLQVDSASSFLQQWLLQRVAGSGLRQGDLHLGISAPPTPHAFLPGLHFLDSCMARLLCVHLWSSNMTCVLFVRLAQKSHCQSVGNPIWKSCLPSYINCFCH